MSVFDDLFCKEAVVSVFDDLSLQGGSGKCVCGPSFARGTAVTNEIFLCFAQDNSGADEQSGHTGSDQASSGGAAHQEPAGSCTIPRACANHTCS